ncbi:MAG: hypothetical protein IPM81_01895 [Saprospirales bacterium]|nr:hypothetical protein [Saprospirales bacterium]
MLSAFGKAESIGAGVLLTEANAFSALQHSWNATLQTIFKILRIATQFKAGEKPPASIKNIGGPGQSGGKRGISGRGL